MAYEARASARWNQHSANRLDELLQWKFFGSWFQKVTASFDVRQPTAEPNSLSSTAV
jgi:hypothetical protein